MGAIGSSRSEAAEMRAEIVRLNALLEENRHTIGRLMLDAQSHRHRADEAEGDLQSVRAELHRIRRALHGVSCDVHASWSAGCVDCRNVELRARIAEMGGDADVLTLINQHRMHLRPGDHGYRACLDPDDAANSGYGKTPAAAVRALVTKIEGKTNG